jgi:hypothetical protein
MYVKMEFMKRFPSVKARKYLENFGFKGGILFKISGKQSLNFNGSHLSKTYNPEYLPECAIE